MFVQDKGIRLGPFEVAPADFALDRGEVVQLSIAFSPVLAGEHSESFVVLCDNGTSTAHQLSGQGKTFSAAQLQQSLLVKPDRFSHTKENLSGSLLYVSRVSAAFGAKLL